MGCRFRSGVLAGGSGHDRKVSKTGVGRVNLDVGQCARSFPVSSWLYPVFRCTTRTPSSQLAAIGSPFRGERGTPSQADRNTGSSTLVVCLGRWITAPNCFDVMNL
jgi:hypothetical protein